MKIFIAGIVLMKKLAHLTVKWNDVVGRLKRRYKETLQGMWRMGGSNDI